MPAPVTAYFESGRHGNRDGYACGGWAIDPHPDVAVLTSRVAGGKCYGGDVGATKDTTEYNVVIDALRAVYRIGYRGPVRLQGNSELVVLQFNNEYRCQDPDLQRLLAHLRRACTFFASVELVLIPEEQNQNAAEQSRLAYQRAHEGRSS